jgi:hypothetical protein
MWSLRNQATDTLAAKLPHPIDTICYIGCNFAREHKAFTRRNLRNLKYHPQTPKHTFGTADALSHPVHRPNVGRLLELF